MKNEWETYRDTGMLGAYKKESAILRQNEDGRVDTIFRDTQYKTVEDEFIQERVMLIGGKRFQVTSVFPCKATATPTEKMLAYIDSELEKESRSA